MIKLNRLITASLFLSLLTLSAWSEDSSVISGYEVGETTQSFTVVDVTGKYAGKRICYVCEYQDEPNVIGFFQTTGDETADFITRMDELYKQNKERHLKAVAVIVAGQEAKPWLEQLNQEKNLEIPLVVLKKGPKDLAVRLYRLNPEVENTFLVNINRKVMANVAGIDTDQFSLVADATTRMLSDNNL